MADRLVDATARLNDRLGAYASRQVVYCRGPDSVTVTASVGSSLLRIATGEAGEYQTIRTDRDYLFAAADLVLGGFISEPMKGDRIEDATDGRAYEVFAPRGEPPWRYSDNRRLRLRVHTQDVGAL